MKKLFTLLALLTCFMGANAKTVTDAEVDFSKYADISEWGFPYSWGGSESARSRLSIQDGCLHFESTEAVDPSWDVQFFPIGGVNAEVDVTYTLHFKIKGDHSANVSMLGFGQTPYGQFSITTEWVEGTVEYVATNNDGNILMQCGDWVGSWDIAYLKITHEESDDQQPIQWANILINGDASAPWDNPNAQSVNNAYDGEGAELVSAYSKEFGVNDNNPHAAIIEDGVFVCRSQIVDPVLVWDSDGEQWGQTHSAGDPMPDNTWQNQFWINFPRPMKDGENFKLSFRYKASENARATSQDHRAPGDYLGGGSYGDLNFTTEWQNYERTITAAAGVQSIAFNLGEDQQYLKDIVYYFDDLNVSLMVLEEGFFVASANIETGMVAYNFNGATKFEEGTDLNGDPALVATVGTKGDEDSWVDQVMISTARGNDKGFKSATIKVSGNVVNDEYSGYTEAANTKINLPAAGVWTIYVAPEENLIMFHQVEGNEIVVKEPLEEIPNTTEIVVHGLERDFTAGEQPADPDAGIEAGTGQPWDNQFFIIANREIKTGEVTTLKFKYRSTVDAHTTTQLHGAPGAYIWWNAIGDVDFVGGDEWQEFEKTWAISKGENDAEISIQSIAFNMAEIKEACDYYITDVVWMTEDMTETLIDTEGTKNFFVKEGAGTAPYEFGTDPASINSVVVNNKVSTTTYNLAGQRVAKEYKGIVVKDGKKQLVK